MKVLFVASGNKNGKPGAVVKNQADSLKGLGISIDFYLVKGKGIFGYLKNVFPLIKHIKRNPPDIIHSHYSMSAMATTIALFFIHRHLHVVSLMGSDAQLKGTLKGLVKLFNNGFWNSTVLKSKQMLIDTGIKKATVIPNGVNIKKVENLDKHISTSHSSKDKTTQKKTVLFAANPNRKSKNYLLAKKAMDIVDSQLKVVYNKTHEEILSEILQTDILLLTSRWEGSPNIIKEAMACNRPIVATDVGDIRWLFGNEPGHYICDFDPQDIAAKIEQALDFNDKNGRTNGRNRIIELGLDSISIAKKLESVYNEVLKK
jgi:glycosyltransferase involved in cell wall biosynthesis